MPKVESDTVSDTGKKKLLIKSLKQKNVLHGYFQNWLWTEL